MKKLLCIMLAAALYSCGATIKDEPKHMNTTEMEKTNIGNRLALYPMPVTVVGAESDVKVNWLLVAHTGIIGHDRILVSQYEQESLHQSMYT